MKLFDHREPQSLADLEQLLVDCEDVPRPYSVAVECLLFDSDGRWILMERGPGCRDEIGKFEGIGGRVEDKGDMRSELRREIAEEVGNDADVEILRFFEVRKDTVTVEKDGQETQNHWLIVSYIGFLKGGELQICEPHKNLGYKRFSLKEIVPTDLSSSTRSAHSSLQSSWPDVASLLTTKSGC